MVQWGSWGVPAASTNTPSWPARALTSPADLDEVFNINVAKMRVSVPAQLKQMLDRPVSELCILADRVYRRHNADASEDADDVVEPDDKASVNGSLSEVGTRA